MKCPFKCVPQRSFWLQGSQIEAAVTLLKRSLCPSSGCMWVVLWEAISSDFPSGCCWFDHKGLQDKRFTALTLKAITWQRLITSLSGAVAALMVQHSENGGTSGDACTSHFWQHQCIYMRQTNYYQYQIEHLMPLYSCFLLPLHLIPGSLFLALKLRSERAPRLENIPWRGCGIL